MLGSGVHERLIERVWFVSDGDRFFLQEAQNGLKAREVENVCCFRRAILPYRGLRSSS